jgi:hypothetical protein
LNPRPKVSAPVEYYNNNVIIHPCAGITKPSNRRFVGWVGWVVAVSR